MSRLRPGWSVALCGLLVWVSAWLPWLTTAAAGGGRASAIGGAAGSVPAAARFGAGQSLVLLASLLVVAGAMSARGLVQRWASAACLIVAAAMAALVALYYRDNVVAPVVAGYGLYLGAAAVTGSVVCSVWAVGSALSAGRRVS